MTIQTDPERVRRAERAAKLSLAVTTCNVAFKLTAGFLTGSISVLAEGMQSFVDILIALGVVLTVRLAALPPDKDHPYGHGKAELLMTAIQMVLILSTALFILYQAWHRLIEPAPLAVNLGIAAMTFSALANFLVSRHLKKVARETESVVLGSEVLHLHSDMYSSLGILAGLLAVWATGWTPLDPLVAAAFTFIVIVTAIRQLARLAHPLMDGALPPQDIVTLDNVLKLHPDVRGYHALRTRMVGALRTVEIHVLLDDELSFIDAHNIAEHVETEMSAALGGALVNVHYEPYQAELEHRLTVHGDDPQAITTL